MIKKALHSPFLPAFPSLCRNFPDEPHLYTFEAQNNAGFFNTAVGMAWAGLVGAVAGATIVPLIAIANKFHFQCYNAAALYNATAGQVTPKIDYKLIEASHCAVLGSACGAISDVIGPSKPTKPPKETFVPIAPEFAHLVSSETKVWWNERMDSSN
jgi:hypothetical protein